MSQEELDLSSLTVRVLQLEENQVVLKRYIAKLKQQLETYQQRFNERAEVGQLKSLMAEFATIQQRLNLEISEQPVIYEPPIELDFQYQLVFDRPSSRAVLMEALSVAQERVIIVCPWLNCNSINDELLQKFRDCLNRGCLIDIGWGYLGDRQNIGKGWRYNALVDLQELANEYPDQLCLNLLGTHENFLVCDSSFAMLGSHNLLTNSDQSAEKELGIRTNDGQIVKQLIERFDSSEVLTEEEIESRFIASSDYLDRADYLEGLAADVEDITLEDSGEDVEDESEECLEPVVSVEEFWQRYSEGETDFTGINLAGADLRGKKLDWHINLSNANLNKANLIGVNWAKINLSGANLKGADMRDSYFYKTNFSYAILKGADMKNSGFCMANFSYAILKGADIGHSNFQQTNFTDAILKGADMRHSNFDDINFSDANLYGANLHRVSLSAANLSRANLRQVNLSGANLSSANLNTADLTKADLRQAELSSAKLRGADLISADLRAANLCFANLSGANLTGAKIGGADFENAELIGTIMPDGSTHE